MMLVSCPRNNMNFAGSQFQNYETLAVPIGDAVNRLRLVNPAGQMVAMAREVGNSFGTPDS